MRGFQLLGLLALSLSACNGADDTDVVDDTDTDTSTACANPIGEDGCVLSGTILEDLTLTADYKWLLSGGVKIGDDVNETVLTIEPGTTIYGESATDGFLIVTRGSKIVADGTADAPIVFTSDQAVGSRARGNWGGLVLNGRAPINACSDGSADCEAEGEGGTGKYGGSDPDDSSGVLRYVRVEFAGTEVSPDNELNGISFGGVGRGTVVDHVQVHANLDDGVEFFGGTVDARHLVISCVGDDGIDWDLGWQGRLQYAVVRQCDDAGGHGIEADGNEADHTAEPFSNPTLSNLTFVGSTQIPEDNFGIQLRRGTGAVIHNTIVTGFTAACLSIRDAATYAHAETGDLAFEHSLIDCDMDFEDDADDPDEADIWAAGAGNVEADPMLAAPGGDDPDFRPSASGPAGSGGVAPSDSFFEAADYLGAFDPAGDDWTDGWTNWAAR